MAKRKKRVSRRNKQSIVSLSVNKLIQLRELFESKSWEIEEGTEISCFDRYVKTLSRLNESQQVFIMNLSYRFLHIPQSDYLEHLIEPVKCLREAYPEKTLIFVACLKKEDLGKIKSSAAVLYQFKGATIKTKVNLGSYKVVDELNAYTAGKINNKNEAQIVLVDDFVGTGETAIKASEYVRELLPRDNNEDICVLSIVTMSNGKKALESQGIRVFSDITCNRGISDYYSNPQLSEAIIAMESIENTLRDLKPDFRFGYKQSEALVCMERCPNNTFPIYWLTKEVAPYER